MSKCQIVGWFSFVVVLFIVSFVFAVPCLKALVKKEFNADDYSLRTWETIEEEKLLVIKEKREKKRQKEFENRIKMCEIPTKRNNAERKKENILRRELKDFFMDIPEVKWVRFKENTVYVGFDPYPIDGVSILRGAALHGNKAINFGCHIWAVHVDQQNNAPYYGTLDGKWYKEVTARYGKFE
jgi:hypothetical protein